MGEVDWEALAKDLGGEAVSLVKGLAGAAKEDVEKFGVGIGKDMVVAVRTNDESWRGELFAQLRGVAELNRIRLEDSAMTFLENGLAMAVRVARMALKAGGIPLS
jgi:hypothetical protein